MADIASYERFSQRVNAADFGVQRLRGLEESGAYGIANSRALDSMAGSFMQEWQRELTQSGSKDGGVVVRNEDGTLGRMEVRDDTTSYGKAFMDAQKAAYGAALTVDASVTFSKLHQQSIAPTDENGKPLPPPENPLQQFREGSKAYIAKTVEGLPKEFQSRVLTEMTGNAARHELALTESVRRIELGQQLGKLKEAGELAMREALSGLRNGDPVIAETKLRDYNKLVDHMASLDRGTFTPDVVRSLKEQGERSIVAVGFEQDTLKVFRKNYSPRFSERAEAAALQHMEGQRASLIARFGQEGAEAVIGQVGRMVRIQGNIMELRDRANERAAQEAFSNALPGFTDAVNRALAGNGQDPLKVQADAKAQIASRFGQRFAAMFEGRTLGALVNHQPDVRAAQMADENWVRNIRVGLETGALRADGVWDELTRMHEDGRMNYVSPATQRQLLGIAENAKLGEIRAEASAAAAALKKAEKLSEEALAEQQKMQEAYAAVRTAMSGEGTNFAVNTKSAKAADFVIEREGWGYETASGGSQTANLMVQGGGPTPQAKERLQAILANPSMNALRSNAGFLSAFMGHRDAEDTIVGFMGEADRRRLSSMWAHWRQYEADAGAAQSPEQREEARSRLDKKLEAERRGAFDGPKSVDELQRFEGSRFSENSDRSVRAAIDAATDGGFTLGRFYSSRPGQKFVGAGVFGDGDVLLKSLDAQGLGDINSMSWVTALNRLPGAATSTAIQGLSALLGGDPSTWDKNVASLPFLGGMLYSWRDVQVGNAERYDLRKAIETEAGLNGGNWEQASKKVSQSWFKDRGFEATLYHGENYDRTRSGKSPVARMVPYPIDAGPQGPDAVRPMLYAIAEKMIGEGVKLTGAGNAWEAMHRSDLWHIEYDGHRLAPDGNAKPSYRVFVRVGDEGSLMQVGGPNQRYFRPEIDGNRSERLRGDADRQAAEIVRSMRFDQRPDEGRDLIGRGWRGQREAFDGTPKGSDRRGPVSAAIMEKAIAGLLYRGAIFKEVGADLAMGATILLPPEQERSVRIGNPEEPPTPTRSDASRINIRTNR